MRKLCTRTLTFSLDCRSSLALRYPFTVVFLQVVASKIKKRKTDYFGGKFGGIKWAPRFPELGVSATFSPRILLDFSRLLDRDLYPSPIARLRCSAFFPLGGAVTGSNIKSSSEQKKLTGFLSDLVGKKTHIHLSGPVRVDAGLKEPIAGASSYQRGGVELSWGWG